MKSLVAVVATCGVRLKGTVPLLSRFHVIPAQAGIFGSQTFLAFNELRDTCLRGYGIHFILEFHVH
jgi:hypothetical protein